MLLILETPRVAYISLADFGVGQIYRMHQNVAEEESNRSTTLFLPL